MPRSSTLTRIDRKLRSLDKWVPSKHKTNKSPNKKTRPLTLREFIQKVCPKFVFYRHCEVLIKVLQDVVDGKRKRVLVFMPPRHGKSELTTRLLPAYFLYRHPNRFASINSYGADLAYGLSRNCREYYKAAGGECKDDADAVKHWETPAGGGVFAAGVGGPILGKGWHLGLIDDPLKNAEEANSERIREKHKDWYDTTFLTREEPWSDIDPDGAIVVVMQRWHEDDLCGYLLERELDEEKDEQENWHIVFFEAIKGETPPRFPSSCTVESDWRSPGEALCPERRPLHKLQKIKARLERAGKGRYWQALFQQAPIPVEGNLVKREWFKYFRQRPAHPTTVVQSWDTANKPNELAAYSVCTTWLITEIGYYLIDVYRDRVASPDLIRAAISLANKFLPNVVLVEDKASGTGLIQHLNATTRISVVAIQPKGDKIMRLSNESPAIEAGRVWLAEDAPWLTDYIGELATAPNAAFMDQCDSTSQFLEWARLNQTKGGADYY